MIFADPVYGTVRVPDTHAFLLTLPPFIRLKNIRQLGFTPSVYIGGVHTRFEHTIGKTKVLIDLMDQLGVIDSKLRSRYIVASLLSEIGTFPYSYNTRWLFAHRMGISKSDFAKLLTDTYITPHLPITKNDKDFIWGDASYTDHAWFRKMTAFSSFPNLTLLQLAGNIDYALRDAHYSGRYSNSFDYRYFHTLVDINSRECQQQLHEAVRELNRSIHALDSVYGNPTRRFLVLIFMRLSKILADNGYLNLDKYKEAAIYVELDDDRFMRELWKATAIAEKEGFRWVKSMLNAVEQLNPFKIEKWELTQDKGILSLSEIEREIADALNVSSQQVIAFSDSIPSEIGYVLLGRFFSCYSEAIESDYFKDMTGLRNGSNRTGLLDSNAVQYIIIS